MRPRPATPRVGRSWSWRGARRRMFWEHEAEQLVAGPPEPSRPAQRPGHRAAAGKPSRVPGALLRARQGDRRGRAGWTHWAVPYWLVDTAFATMLLLLGLAQEGLGSLFFALQKPAGPLLGPVGVPDGWEPLGAVAIGWPSPDDRPLPPPDGPASPGPRSCTGVAGAASEARMGARPGGPGCLRALLPGRVAGHGLGRPGLPFHSERPPRAHLVGPGLVWGDPAGELQPPVPPAGRVVGQLDRGPPGRGQCGLFLGPAGGPALARGSRLCSWYFAASTVVEVAIGQLPTLAGESMALASVLMMFAPPWFPRPEQAGPGQPVQCRRRPGHGRLPDQPRRR